MTPVDPEIRVGGQQLGIVHRFGHAEKLDIGQACRDGCVLVHERQNGRHVSAQRKRDGNSVSPKEGSEVRRPGGAEKVEGLGQRSFTCVPRRRKALGLGDGPSMVRIPAAEQRHEETGVNENASNQSRNHWLWT